MSARTHFRTLAFGLLCVGAGVFAQRLWMRPGPAQESDRGDARAIPATSATSAAFDARSALRAERSLDMARMRQVMREELDTALERRAADQPVPEPSAVAAEPAEAPVVKSFDEYPDDPSPSYLKARTGIDAGIARGAWTDRDRDELTAALSTMRPDERHLAIGYIIRAVNRGQLRAEMTGPLLF